MANILITDGLWHKTVVAIRALGKNNLNLTVTGDNLFTSGFYSRYCHRRLVLPSATANPNQFSQKLLTEIKSRHYDLLIPMEDSTIKSIMPHRFDFEKYVSFPLPDNQSLGIAFDKAKTLKLAESINIDIPKTYYDYQKINPQKINIPLISKPPHGSGSRGLVYLQTKEKLISHLEFLKNNHLPALIQEQIPSSGEEVGVNLLFNYNHQPVAGFTYRRLRDYPVSGGPSTLRESTDDPQLLKTAVTLLSALNWVGVAMVEFKRDPRDGKTKLMEINPRFWGSLVLPVASGVNFPYLLYLMATRHPFDPVFTYKVGLKARWLIPGDILHFLSNPNRFKLKPGFFNFFDKNTVYDDFDPSDPIGNLGVIFCNLFQSLNPHLWSLAFRRNYR